MSLASASTQKGSPQAIKADRLAGLVLEVGDLEATRAFYDPIFRTHPGEWVKHEASLTYRTATEAITFARRRLPRTFPSGGHHQGYRVPRGSVRRVTEELVAAGHTVDWWREDHPHEQLPAPYLHDPSGNRVQLVGADGGDALLDHVAIEVYEFDYCEYLYVTSLCGAVDYYYGWRSDDRDDAKLMGAGDDPCAPWTRRDNPHYRDFLVEDPVTHDLRPARFGEQFGVEVPNRQMRITRPNGQVYLRYGPTRLVMISATKVRQEPREEQVKGTPRLVFTTEVDASSAAQYLKTTVNSFRRNGRNIYLRDADGNFSELICRE